MPLSVLIRFILLHNKLLSHLQENFFSVNVKMFRICFCIYHLIAFLQNRDEFASNCLWLVSKLSIKKKGNVLNFCDNANLHFSTVNRHIQSCLLWRKLNDAHNSQIAWYFTGDSKSVITLKINHKLLDKLLKNF